MKDARTQKGLTKRELAEAVGCSESMIAKIEAGIKCPSIKLAGKLSKRLGKSVDSLFIAKK